LLVFFKSRIGIIFGIIFAPLLWLYYTIIVSRKVCSKHGGEAREAISSGRKASPRTKIPVTTRHLSNMIELLNLQ
jgi:hypothetical protein